MGLKEFRFKICWVRKYFGLKESLVRNRQFLDTIQRHFINPPDTSRKPCKHPPDTLWTPSKHLPDIFQTPSSHLPVTYQSPPRHLTRHPHSTPSSYLRDRLELELDFDRAWQYWWAAFLVCAGINKSISVPIWTTELMIIEYAKDEEVEVLIDMSSNKEASEKYKQIITGCTKEICEFLGYIWLKLTRMYIPIRRMLQKRSHSRTSHAVIFHWNCTGFFAFGQKLIRDKWYQIK